MITTRFDAKTNKIIVEIAADKAAWDAAPDSSSGKTRLLTSAGSKVQVQTPHGIANLAINTMIPKK